MVGLLESARELVFMRRDWLGLFQLKLPQPRQLESLAKKPRLPMVVIHWVRGSGRRILGIS